MNKVLVFLRQIYFPYRATITYDKWDVKPMIVGAADETPETPVLPPSVDTVARVIGLFLALFGTASIGGLTFGQWFDFAKAVIC